MADNIPNGFPELYVLILILLPRRAVFKSMLFLNSHLHLKINTYYEIIILWEFAMNIYKLYWRHIFYLFGVVICIIRNSLSSAGFSFKDFNKSSSSSSKAWNFKTTSVWCTWQRYHKIRWWPFQLYRLPLLKDQRW